MPREMVGHPNLILETLPEICEKNGWGFKSNPKKLWEYNEWDAVHCQITAKDFNAIFMLQQMPGCCAVLTASYIDPNPYEQKYFALAVDAIREAAYEAGFGSLVLTQVLHYNRMEKHLWGPLLALDWEISKPFVNAKSGNRVVYLTRNLNQVAKRPGLEIQL